MDLRITSGASSRISLGSLLGYRIRARSVLKAVEASFFTGCDMVVSGGVVERARAMSSKPTTAMSLGTHFPSLASVSRRRAACSSFPNSRGDSPRKVR